jgi:hypothetical protein
MSSPQGVLLIPDTTGHTRVIVGDTANNRVLIWKDLPGQNIPADAVLGMPDISTLSSTGAYGGVSEGSVQTPWSLASDGTSLVVADQALNRMLIWNTIPSQLGNGMPIIATGIWGQRDYITSLPNQGNPVNINSTGVNGPLVAFDSPDSSTTRFFVSDSANSRVMVFDGGIPMNSSTGPTHLLGKTSPTDGSFGCSRQKLHTPLGLAVGLCAAMPNAGCPVFIADSANNRVVGFPPSQFTASPPMLTLLIGQTDFTNCQPNRGLSTSNSTLSNPQSVCYSDTLKAIFVADQGNHRVLGFTGVTGIGLNASPPYTLQTATYLLGQAAFGDNQPNGPTGIPSAATMNSPSDIRCDGTHIIVADTGNHRVLVWTNIMAALTGTPMGLPANIILGQPQGTNSVVPNMPSPDGVLHFNNPTDVASDGTALAVADTGNQRPAKPNHELHLRERCRGTVRLQHQYGGDGGDGHDAQQSRWHYAVAVRSVCR